ncbi:hypothetical protein MHBO_000656 [Bonamia ostreae]|uniref:LAGLIDADG homing endonuclease n=1 Tax=Bonamia ostreae TaxID=126728 RepID=A0ABV2AGC8_9EUKA
MAPPKFKKFLYKSSNIKKPRVFTFKRIVVLVLCTVYALAVTIPISNSQMDFYNFAIEFLAVGRVEKLGIFGNRIFVTLRNDDSEKICHSKKKIERNKNALRAIFKESNHVNFVLSHEKVFKYKAFNWFGERRVVFCVESPEDIEENMMLLENALKLPAEKRVKIEYRT